MKLPVWIHEHLHCARQFVWTGVLSLLLVGLMTSTPVMAVAQPQPQSDQRAEEVGPVNQEQALERVRANFPGTVISINEVRQNGRLRYRVRLDNEGNIYTVFVDQATGALSRE